VKTVRTIASVRSALDAARRERHTIGLVPTMGAFHEGHLSLMRSARAECDAVVVSLFVNPTQFVTGEDLTGYPRDERRDADLAAAAGVDLLFAPAAAELYPAGFSTAVEVSGASELLCGDEQSRGAEHFRGVATIVTKLLNICRPDVAYFGQKDFQQTLVIRQLVRDLDLPVRIVVGPTVRDPDGLALSSRNAYLSPDERRRARALKCALDAAGERLTAGVRTREEALAPARAELEAAGVSPEYLELLRADDLAEPTWAQGERVVVAIAARIGRARLIDNVVITLAAPDRSAAQVPARAAEPVSG
jgi:pantoate--beta-alanine ligase